MTHECPSVAGEPTFTSKPTHRGHAIVEQVIADLKKRPLAVGRDILVVLSAGRLKNTQPAAGTTST